MTHPAIDIIAIGDAIVDVIATCDDAFIAAHDLPKGGMQLLDSESADRLYAAMGNARETSGGSAANSMAGIAAMGGRAASSARSPTTSWATSSATTCTRWGCVSIRRRCRATARFRPGAA